MLSQREKAFRAEERRNAKNEKPKTVREIIKDTVRGAKVKAKLSFDNIKGALKSKEFWKKAIISLVVVTMISGFAVTLMACNPQNTNPGDGPVIDYPVDPPVVEPPVENGGGTGDENTPTIDPNQDQGNENQGGEIDDNGGQENQGGEQGQGEGGGEQTPEVHNMDFEGFMTNRDAIAQKIVEENESAILLSNLTKATAAKHEIVSYSINLTENQNCNEISTFEITYLSQNPTSGVQYVATSTITLSESITDSNYEDLTIANIQGNGKYAISAEDSQQTELKTALAEAFLAKAGISFNYTADDIYLYNSGSSLSGTYSSVENYTIVIANDNGVVKLEGHVKSSSNMLSEIENDHIEGVTGQQLEDFHTIAEHQVENENE